MIVTYNYYLTSSGKKTLGGNLPLLNKSRQNKLQHMWGSNKNLLWPFVLDLICPIFIPNLFIVIYQELYQAISSVLQ